MAWHAPGHRHRAWATGHRHRAWGTGRRAPATGTGHGAPGMGPGMGHRAPGTGPPGMGWATTRASTDVGMRTVRLTVGSTVPPSLLR